MMKIDWKKIAPYLVALVVFVGFAVLYCSPMLEGKVLVQGDINNWKGAAQEVREYYQQTGETSWWTNSMFGGMPTFQIAGSVKSVNVVSWLRHYTQNALGEPPAAICLYFIGFFLMLLCFGVNPWLSIVGALAIGMSSYFFLIIPAGHMSKAFALGALAPMLHPQMTYYVGMLIGVMVIAEIILACMKKDWKGIGIALAILIACLGLSYGARYTSMKMNQDYLKQTMRGGHSELTKQAQDKPAEGLDLKYATDWSYGKGETMTLLIPNWEGGASGYDLGKEAKTRNSAKRCAAKVWINARRSSSAKVPPHIAGRRCSPPVPFM